MKQLALGHGDVVATEPPRRRAKGSPDVWLHESRERVEHALTKTCSCGAGLGERCRPDVAYRVPPPAGGAGVWFAFHAERLRGIPFTFD